MKEFGRAIEDVLQEQAGQERVPLTTVILSGHEIVLFEPTAGALAYMVTVAESYGEDETVRLTATLLTFIGDLMSEEDRRHLLRAIRTGALTDDDIMDLFTEFTEAAGARPTPSSAASSPSRQPTGPRSTATSRRVASTRSATSRRTGSSTSSTRD